MIVKHPNRSKARKQKQGGCCKMCKPHKGKWEHRFKKKDRLEREQKVHECNHYT